MLWMYVNVGGIIYMQSFGHTAERYRVCSALRKKFIGIPAEETEEPLGCSLGECRPPVPRADWKLMIKTAFFL